MCVPTEEADTKATDKLKGTEKTFGNEGEDDHDHGHKMRHGLGWGKGIIADLKRTVFTHWKAEMTNLNGKVSLPGQQFFFCTTFSCRILSHTTLFSCRLLQLASFCTLLVSPLR